MEPTAREKRFVSSIGIDLISSEAPERFVAAAWDELGDSLALEGSGWKKTSTRIQLIHPGAALLALTYQKETTLLSIELFVASDGSLPARKHLVEVAARTMTKDIPYVRGPPGLGEVSVRHQNPQISDFLWVFRNICARVESDGMGSEMEAIALRVQRFLEKNQVAQVTQYLPGVAKILASTTRLKQGQEFRIEVQLKKSADTSKLLVVIEEAPGEQFLDERWSKELSAGFAAQHPGRATIHVMIADKVTLLSLGERVSVDISPSQPP